MAMESIGGEQDRRAKRAMSINEFAARYGVGRSKVYEELNAKRLRGKKAGRRTVIGSDDAEAWFAALPEIGD